FREDDGSQPPLAVGTATGAPDQTRRKVIVYDFLFSGDSDNVSPTSSFDNQGHGTLVAGNALGSDVDNPFSPNINNGIAPGAQLIVQDGGFTNLDNRSDLAALGCPVTSLEAELNQAIAQGAHFHNNSWGDREN